jgi:hypothetical protein
MISYCSFVVWRKIVPISRQRLGYCSKVIADTLRFQEEKGEVADAKPSKPAWGKLPSAVPSTKPAVLSNSGVAWPSLGDAKDKKAVSAELDAIPKVR